MNLNFGVCAVVYPHDRFVLITYHLLLGLLRYLRPRLGLVVTQLFLDSVALVDLV